MFLLDGLVAVNVRSGYHFYPDVLALASNSAFVVFRLFLVVMKLHGFLSNCLFCGLLLLHNNKANKAPLKNRLSGQILISQAKLQGPATCWQAPRNQVRLIKIPASHLSFGKKNI